VTPFSTRRAALATALLLLALAGCARGPAPIHVASVRVADGALAEPLAEAGLDAPALEAAARAGLSDAGFRLGEGKRSTRARVDVLAVRFVPPDPRDGIPRVEVAVELELTPVGTEGPEVAREVGTATAPLGPRGPGGAARDALGLAARRAAEALAIGFSAEAKPIERLIAELDAPDARVRDQAARVLAERKSAAAVPALIERLRDDDPDVVSRAIGALAQIGDARAVDPLIEVSYDADPGFTGRVARIIGDIGGPDAEGYLLTLASGHPDPGVRRSAGEALEELRGRAAGPAVAAGR
jgi:hypothetical protein